MAKTASDRLIEKATPYKSGIGISIADIAKMPLTEEAIDDIKKCLQSGDAGELKWGLWFARGILDSRPPNDLLLLLVANLPQWMAHENSNIREVALPLLIRLRENFNEYRVMMLKNITDSSPDVRSKALAAYSTYLTKSDVPTLLKFQDDGFLSETSMNSPLVYAIRNQALSVIEELTGKTFQKFENVKALDGGHMAYWWDWQPVLTWWSEKGSKL